MIKPYKQTIYESCLAVALMLISGIKSTSRRELEIWKRGWQFSFVINQLNYFSDTYNSKFGLYIENKPYCESLKKIANKRLVLEQKPINLKLIRNKLENGPIILYIDNYLFQKTVHTPHFVLVESQHQNIYTIIDSWDGKIKLVPAKELMESVNHLKKNMLHSPILIYKK